MFKNIFYLIFLLIQNTLHHKCAHDKFKKTIKHKIKDRSQLKQIKTITGRRLENKWRPIDIKYDLSNI